MGRLLATGDIHGWEGSWWKLREECFPEGAGLGKDDVLLVTGDVAACFHCGADAAPRAGERGQGEALFREWLESRPWTPVFVDGNHENHEARANLPVAEWHGGLVHRVSPSVMHLMRGQAYRIPVTGADGEEAVRTVFAMGGARSTDRALRTEGVSWWPSELPTYDEIDAAEATLDALGWEVDVVATHAQPPEVAAAALGDWLVARDTDRLTAWLGYVRDRLSYGLWLSGHLHVDEDVLGGRDMVLFDRVVDVGALLA